MLVKKLIDENLLEASTADFYEGDFLFTAGSSPKCVYHFIEGKAQLENRNGEVIQQYLPGSVAGLADLLNEQHKYSARVTEASKVQVINRTKLIQFIEKNPALRIYFLKLLSLGVMRAKPMFE